jgi:thiamine kinase-like enzyme
MADIPADRLDAVERLRALPIWSSAPRFSPCPGGRTNENFRVDDGGRIFFARVGIDLPHHFVTRANEAHSYRLAAAAGVAPPLIHAANGILVTEFIEGRTLAHDQPTDDATLALVADALRQVHGAPTPSDLHPFDPLTICRGNLAALPDGAIEPRRRERLEAALNRAPRLTARCLIHADLIPENFIIQGSRAFIVDWEYAGLGDPAVDLAQTIVLFDLAPRQASLLLDRHGDADAAKIEALKPILAAREVLWCEAQAHHVGVRGDLPEYRALCWRKFESIVA